jgi:biotin transport system permease protein
VISLYRQGNSVIHKTPVGLKLLSLAALLAAAGLVSKTAYTSAAALAVVFLVYLSAGQSVRDFLNLVWKMKFLIAIVLIPQIIFNGLVQGSNNSVLLLTGVMLASLISITTKTSEIVDLLQRITRSRSFALLIALSLNSIGLVIGFSKNISEAGQARGVRPNPVRQIVNLFVVSLRYADEYAEALAARGVRV